jgi:23S rRNA pseudouridine1911/1915/1917 synthase
LERLRRGRGTPGYDTEREDRLSHTHRIIADRGDAGRRLDLVLRRHLADVPGATRTRVQAWIEDGCVSVNGAPARRAAARAALGDDVIVSVPLEDSRPRRAMTAERLALDVLFEDAHLVAVHKPAGIVCHPTFKNSTGTLMNALLWHARAWPTPARPSLVGRLDKLTSGVVVAAKSSEMHAALQRALAAADSEKDYLAIVYGKVNVARGRIDLRLGFDTHDRRRMAASIGVGAASLTEFERLGRLAAPPIGLALLRCRLMTGRRHQIRAHLAARGWPIVGDAVYGEAKWTRMRDLTLASRLSGLNRQALHAWRVAFTHPVTGERVQLEAPVPEDLSAVIGYFDAIV